ncbi:ABC transporter permease [Chloroflexota bacterium]
MMNSKVVIYFPDKSIEKGYLSLFREMFSEIFKNQWLTYQLFKRNFTATYKQSVLGVFWALLIPLVSVGIFIFLNRGGIFNVGDIAIPYPLFAVAGMALWQFFSVGLTLGTGSLASAGAMITKINFPRKALVISAVAQGFVTGLIPIVVVFILFAIYGIMPPLTALLVPLAIIPLLFLTIGLGFLLSLVNGVLRDAGNGISIVVTFMLFATPVLYAKPSSGIVTTVSNYNPLYYLIAVPRDLLVTGVTHDFDGYIYSAVFSFVAFIVCLMIFHLSETVITERI